MNRLLLSSTTPPVRLAWLFAALLILSVGGGYARADLIVRAGSSNVTAGTTGNALEVTLENTGPAAVTVGAFSFGLNITGLGVEFTEANTGTTQPYIFPASAFGPIISTTPPPVGPTVIASDLDASFLGVVVNPGDTVGLGNVLFDVSPSSASGSVTVIATPFPTTSLSDAVGNNIPITNLVNGEIAIQPAPTPVPEPSTLALALLMGAATFGLNQCRRRSGPNVW